MEYVINQGKLISPNRLEDCTSFKMSTELFEQIYKEGLIKDKAYHTYWHKDLGYLVVCVSFHDIKDKAKISVGPEKRKDDITVNLLSLTIGKNTVIMEISKIINNTVVVSSINPEHFEE